MPGPDSSALVFLEGQLPMAQNMYGIVDIGSNTIRFNIYTDNKNRYRVVAGKKNFAGLSAYVEEGVMTESGTEKVIKYLNKFKRTLEDLNIKEYYIFATAAIRNVSNSCEVMKKIQKETGLKVNLLSGKLESYCDLIGLLNDRPDLKDGYLIDIGGGSTEIILFKNRTFTDYSSIPEGSLSLYKKFVKRVLPTPAEREKIMAYVRDLVKACPVKKEKVGGLYGVGGTIRATGNINQERYGKKTNREVQKNEVEDLLQSLVMENSTALHYLLQVAPERAHTQVPGLCILLEVMNAFFFDWLEVSRDGVREGYLYYRKNNLRLDALEK